MPTIFHPREFEQLPAATLDDWRDIASTILSDVTKGRVICDAAIRPLAPSSRICGQALTVRCDPADSGAVIHAIEGARAGDIIVVDTSGDAEHAVLGELFAGTARVAGVAGILVDGSVRDIGTLRTWADLPVWSRYTRAQGSPGKSEGEINCPISFGGRVVSPGDLIIADDDGIAVIPFGEVDAIYPKARDRAAFEAECEAQIATGEKATGLFGIAAYVASAG